MQGITLTLTLSLSLTLTLTLTGTDKTWRQVAASQLRTLGRTQALQTGLTEHAWNWALGKQRWHPSCLA